jgi:Tat protein translocase TatB subunit
MFGIGAGEMLIIAIVLLIAVGPTRLPKLLKSGVQMYREFRRATRELRASTGIDEILQDEDLRDLRKPLHIPPAKQKPIAAAKPTRQRALSYTERVQEVPPEGVDLAELRDAERRPSPEEAERIRAAKDAVIQDPDAIRREKIAAAERTEVEPSEGERIRAAKMEAAARSASPMSPESLPSVNDDPDRIRAAKIAAARESEGVREAKRAAAEALLGDEPEEG